MAPECVPSDSAQRLCLTEIQPMGALEALLFEFCFFTCLKKHFQHNHLKLKPRDPLICSHHTFYSFVTLIDLSLSACLDYGLHEGTHRFAYPCNFTESGTNQISVFVDHGNTQVSVDQDDRACFWSTDISLPCFNKRIYVFGLSTWSVSYRLCVLATTVIIGLISSQQHNSKK